MNWVFGLLFGGGGLVVAGLVILAIVTWKPFFRGAIAAIALAVVVTVAIGLVGYGVSLERAACNARFAEAEARFSALNAEIVRLTQEHATKLASVIDEKDKELQGKIDEYEQRLSGNKDAACLLDESDVRDIGSLRYGPKSAPAGKQ